MAAGGKRPPARWTWAIREDRSLSEHAIVVYLILHTRGADARPSLATLADDCHISRSTAKRAVAELAKAGWLTVEHRRTDAGDKDTSRYLLACPAEAKGRSTQTPRRGLTEPTSRSTQTHEVVKGKGKTEVGNKQTSTRTRRAAQPGPGQEPMPGLLVALPAPVVKAPTAADVVAAYCDGAAEAGMGDPGKKSIGRVGRDAKRMLAAGADPEELMDAARRMGGGPWDDLDRQVKLSRSGYRKMQTTEERVSGGLALAAELAVEWRS